MEQLEASIIEASAQRKDMQLQAEGHSDYTWEGYMLALCFVFLMSLIMSNYCNKIAKVEKWQG
eukprot:5433512-Amphidinium_carterae.1